MRMLVVEHIKKAGERRLVAIPCAFTFLNAFCGLLAVVSTIEQDFLSATFFIVAAACFDLCDGRVARFLHSTSYFGTELDSLCDAISFCLAPAVLLYEWRLHQLGAEGLVLLGVYLCAGLSRLARFNGTAQEQQSHFSGLPTPAAALFFASIVVCDDIFAQVQIVNAKTGMAILSLLVVLISLLMISRVPFPSSKGIRLTKKSLLSVISAGIVGLFFFGKLFFPVVMMGYIMGTCCFAVLGSVKHRAR